MATGSMYIVSWLVVVLFVRLASGDKNMAFEIFLDEYWNWRLEQSPEFATKVDVHYYDDKWQNLTEETFEKDTNTAREFLLKSEKIDPEDLDDDDAITLNVIRTSLRSFISGYKYRKYTQYNPVTPLDYPSRDWKNTVCRMPKKTINDYLNLIQRYNGIPGQINQIISLMRKAIELNTTQHSAALIGAVDRLDSLLEAIDNKTSFFHEPLLQIPETFSEENRTDLSERLNVSLNTEIKPAVEKFRDFLIKEYLPNTRPLPGISSVPDGAALYSECLKWHLDLDLTPQNVYNHGVSEVARIKAEIIKLIKADNFTGNMSEYLDYLKNKPENYYSSEEAMLDGYREILKGIHLNLYKVIPNIPKNCPVIVEQNRNPVGWSRYVAITDEKEGVFLISVSHPETRPTFAMTAIALHETEPGHHTQECYIRASGGKMKGRQISYLHYYAVPYNFPFFTSFSEGWGLYAESLGEEMGMYDTSNKRLGKYLNEIFRAARLVVDPGIHYFNWSKKKAVEYLAKYSTRSHDDIVNEINRYIAWPGQACSYKIGELHIKKLRKKAEKILGKHFDKRYFHDEILKLGAIPLSLLDSHLDKWTEKIKRDLTSGCSPFVNVVIVWLPAIILSVLGLNPQYSIVD